MERKKRDVSLFFLFLPLGKEREDEDWGESSETKEGAVWCQGGEWLSGGPLVSDRSERVYRVCGRG